MNRQSDLRRLWLGLSVPAFSLIAAGCGGGDKPQPALENKSDSQPPASVATNSKSDDSTPKTPVAPSNPETVAKPPMTDVVIDNPAESIKVGSTELYLKSFEDAVSLEAIEGQNLPPDTTIAGVSVGKLASEVQATWAKIPLLTKSGQTIPYVLTFDTPKGPFEITLRPDWAPNHVRHLVAISRAGYYNGLQFDRIIQQEDKTDTVIKNGEKKARVDLMIAGCPAGIGDAGIGHIGYFVQSEVSSTLTHEVGTVGIWHDGDANAGGVRFYVCFDKTPAMDGLYTVVGKVTRGLDVLKKAAEEPTRSRDPNSPLSERPQTPLKFQKVTVKPN